MKIKPKLESICNNLIFTGNSQIEVLEKILQYTKENQTYNPMTIRIEMDDNSGEYYGLFTCEYMLISLKKVKKLLK